MTTISIKITTKEHLDKLKLVPNETYDHLIERMVKQLESQKVPNN